MSVILLSEDLIITSQVAGAAARQNVDLHTTIALQELFEQPNRLAASLVILDLSLAGIDPCVLVKNLRELADHPIRVVAFGPHVHQDRLSAARAAGCDEVLSRGQFYTGIDDVLSAGNSQSCQE